MTDQLKPGSPAETPPAVSLTDSRDAVDLRLELARARSEIESLNAELAETNNGVIALYAELDDQAEALREASDLKSRFLSYMSHEFRVPLGAIRSIARILLDKLDGPLTEEQEKQVKFIQGSAVDLSEMVDDLLDLAKVEAGRITISPAWFEMVDLFSALRGMFKPILTNPEVSLVFDEPPDLPRLYTDDKKLSQILRNFISNALKFTLKGEVRVAVARGAPGWVIFTVSDTGIGIHQQNLASLFQDFVQVDSPIQKRMRGSGLGLALSKKFAELLGGRVRAESEPGVGSHFFVEIPVCSPVSESPASTQSEAEGERPDA
ncbi:MAG: histidine kinase [Planctomycetaceae bacterium]|nr:histidine kinase [Planctomycetaceae bacterium]